MAEDTICADGTAQWMGSALDGVVAITWTACMATGGTAVITGACGLVLRQRMGKEVKRDDETPMDHLGCALGFCSSDNQFRLRVRLGFRMGATDRISPTWMGRLTQLVSDNNKFIHLSLAAEGGGEDTRDGDNPSPLSPAGRGNFSCFVQNGKETEEWRSKI